MYRPFVMEWLYFNRQFNERVYQQPKLFPSPNHKNAVISTTGIGAAKSFSGLLTNVVPNYHMHDTGQSFPLYWYEEVEKDRTKPQGEMFSASNAELIDGYIRHDAITDWALATFRKHYEDESINKGDIFCYVYGILHSPEYKSRFATDLKKMLPRIPFAQNFHAFCDAGRKLGDLHLNYETVEPYPLKEERTRLDMGDQDDYLVGRSIDFGKKAGKPDKTVIIYNNHITLRDVPLEAYQYIVNGKPAIEWLMERYVVKPDKDSGIVNDANEWSDDPRYIIDLFKRIVRVSLETVAVVKELPPLNESK